MKKEKRMKRKFHPVKIYIEKVNITGIAINDISKIESNKGRIADEKNINKTMLILYKHNHI